MAEKTSGQEGAIVNQKVLIACIKSNENTNNAQWNPVAQKMLAAAKKIEASQK